MEKENFSHAFTALYAGVVDYRPGCTVTHVDSASRVVTYDQVVNRVPVATNAQVQAAVLNPIPPQRAPQLLKDAGLLSADPREAVRPGQRAELPVDGRSAHPRHRRRQPDDAAEGRAHRQPAGQDLRRRHRCACSAISR